MAKSVNLGSVMEGIFAIAVGLIMCESDAPGRSLTVSNINNIRSQVKSSMYTRAGFTKVLFRGKQYKVKTKGNQADYVPDFVTVTLQVSLKEGEVSSAYGQKFFDNTKESVIQKLISQVVSSATKYKKDLEAAKNQYLLNQMPEKVDIVIVADGVGGEQSGGDLKGDVAVNISINGEQITNQDLNFSLKAGTTPSKTISNESPFKSMSRINEIFKLGIDAEKYSFLANATRTGKEKFEKVKYTQMFYEETLDGLVRVFNEGQGSERAWQFLKDAAFGKDYAAVVSIGATKTNESSIAYINALQNRYPILLAERSPKNKGHNVKFIIKDIDKPLFQIRYKNRSEILGDGEANIKELKMMIETEAVFKQPKDFDPAVGNIGV
tara:strand:+ start:84 stop:1223 length:1140 start_codon:yes stop_codon:yes gene_type:complete